MNISVIIPTYNRMDFLCRAIDSVLEQTVIADEIIVIDDGSTDNTRSMMKNRYPQINYVYQKNKGVSAARNHGIRLAQNPWIAFLDSDDKWHKNKLALQLEALSNSPEYRICHSNEIWLRHGKKVNQKKKHQKRGGYIFKYCLPMCVISPSSVIVQREIFDEIGIFDETLPACEDYDLWLRICAKYPVAYVDNKIVEKYGGHDGQLSAKFWGMDRFRIRALEKLLSIGGLNDEQKQLVQQTLTSKLNIYINGARKHHNYSAESEFKSLIELIS